MELLDVLLKFVGEIAVVGGGLVLLVYQAFKHLAAKWLDARFDGRLEELKHEQQKELEQLRYKVSALLDRAVKLHQREFDVLPEAWAKLNDAYWYVRSFTSSIQSYPDIDRMNPAQQEEFIAGCRLQDRQKAELMQTTDKYQYYQNAIFWHKLAEANEKSSDANTYLIKNGIFINEELRQKFTVIHNLFWNALTEHQTNKQYDVLPRNHDHINRLITDGDDLMKALEREIHTRLWPTSNGL
ncbi:MAG: hypothetical protein WC856_21765 [Methylococcaceae bacterium]|jgi:hypothetical protein